MIDLDVSLDQMLERIQWTPNKERLTSSDLRDDKLYTLEECHVTTTWRPSEYDIVDVLSDLYLRKFPLSFSDLYDDLVKPVKRGIGNAVKRGNKDDLNQAILLEHFFTKSGVVISITDQGQGFDYRQTLYLFEKKAGVFANAHRDGAFRRFSKCGSVISYADCGRTLLIQYCPGRAAENVSVGRPGLANGVVTTLDILRGSPIRKNRAKLVSCLAKFGAHFLESFWASPEFIKSYVYRCLPEDVTVGCCPESGRVRVVDMRRRAVTVQYEIGATRVFGKFYRSGEKGAHTYRVLKTLWDEGFHAGETFQVAEALSYFPDHRFLLSREAGGMNVKSFIYSERGDLVEACRKAAGWLVRLHSSSLRLRRPETNPERSHRFAEMVLREATERFGEHPRVSDHIRRLAPRLRSGEPRVPADGRGYAQIHGDLKPDHVFISNEVTTVIDFDRCTVGAPAADVAMFVCGVRNHVFQARGGAAVAERLTRTFLEEYFSCLPHYSHDLGFHWDCATLALLARTTRGLLPRGLLDSYINYYAREFESSHKLLGELGLRN